MHDRVSLLTLAAVVALAGCVPKPEEDPMQSGRDAGGGMPERDASLSPSGASKVVVSGLVLDVVGERIAGVSVELGHASVESGADGEFSFGLIAVGETQTLVVSRAGYGTGRVVFRPLAGVPTYVKITLQSAEMVTLADSSQGGEVRTESGAVLNLPPNSVVDADGNPVTGPVEVTVSLINDRDEMAAAPPMSATDPNAASDAPAAELESFGMVSVDLTSNGMPVHLAGGSEVELSFPMSAGSHFMPGEALGLWHFDEFDQLWKSDGEGSVDASNNFHALASHFSWWNADQVLTKTCMRGRVLGANGDPVPSAIIEGQGRSYMGSTHAMTGMQGDFCLEARVSSVVEVSTLVHVGDQEQALAVHVTTPRTPATCQRPADCYELPAALVAVADQPLCRPSQCPADPGGARQACCVTDLGPCDFVVSGDCGGAEDGSWDVPSETPGVAQIPGVPMPMPPISGDAGIDSGVPPVEVQDAGMDAALDASVDSGEPATCGPFWQTSCNQCLRDSCNSEVGACFGPDWQAGTFDGVCQTFAQCLCDLQSPDPSGCDSENQPQECGVCMVDFNDCIKDNCGSACGGGGGGGGSGGGDGGGGGSEPVERCSGLTVLSTLETISDSTLDSSLANDWYDDGACGPDLPGRGYLPGFERSYSVTVPAHSTIRARVAGTGMVVLIAADCADIDGSCRSAGNTAAWSNGTGAARTGIITVDNSRVDVQGPFQLFLSTATPSCGDGFVDANEECDDGGTGSSDGCGASCHIESGWACPGDTPCHPVVCGDGIRENGVHTTAHEDCDDGNIANEDGCDEHCTVEPNWVCEPDAECLPVVCGDGIIHWQYESCDDGNSEISDGCGSDCQVEDGWTCGKSGDPCFQTQCGDGLIGNPEQCDDGDDEPGDGCDADCQLEDGWFCPQTGSACREIECGDDMVDFPFEDCEDGDTVSGDGCNSSCRVEAGYQCDQNGRNCEERPAGDLCNNAEALPSGLYEHAYSLVGMSSDNPGCMGCQVNRWFTLAQEPGEVTTVLVSADFEGTVQIVEPNCPVPGLPGNGYGHGFGQGAPTATSLVNDSDSARTVWVSVGGYMPTGNFELLVKTGPRGCGDGMREGGYDGGMSMGGGGGESEVALEDCDDLNVVAGDGCSATCHNEPGYRCPYEGGACTRWVCGDGQIDTPMGGYYPGDLPGEECDDHNTQSGDGCSSSCLVEDGALCQGYPSICEFTAEGDQCSNPLPLPLGSSEHPIDTFNPDFGCHELCSGTDLWFSQQLLPREVLNVQVAGSFEGQLRVFSAAASGCASRHEVGNSEHASFGPSDNANVSVTNNGNTPLTILVAVASYEATTGTFSLAASVEVPAEDCSQGSCVDVVCGDGLLQGTEQCDDGATVSTDGCSSDCVREVGFACHDIPSVCAALPPGDSCEAPQMLTIGSYDFDGLSSDQDCSLTCAPSLRWFHIDVPAEQTLVVRLSTEDISYGQAWIFDMSKGDCGHRGTNEAAPIQFNPHMNGYGGLVNRADISIPVVIAVADIASDEPDHSFNISHSILQTGCGDFWVDEFGQFGASEQCDDGNSADGDGCSASCALESGWDCWQGVCTEIVCGDGVLGGAETCDDGNSDGSDGCSALCVVEEGYLCGGTPSICRMAQPGDTCDTASPLVDQSYSLADYVPDLGCENLCSGPDRWFELDVPAGNTLGVFASSEAQQISMVGFEINAGCENPMPRGSGQVGSEEPGRLFWTNNSPSSRHFAFAIVDLQDPSSATVDLTHVLGPAGCGDAYRDPEGNWGDPEQCDDGNTASDDGCSSTCTIESGFVCAGTPSVCVIPPPGDTCDTADALSEGDYELADYLPDERCDNVCGGPDRWFTISVPAGQLLDIEVTSTAMYSSVLLFQGGPDCDALTPLVADSFPSGQPGQLLWHNTGIDPVTVLLALEDHAPHSVANFSVSYRIDPPGCGDGYIDFGGQFGLSESCDDGNSVGNDGCSASCTTE